MQTLLNQRFRFFAAVNHLRRHLRKQKFTLTGLKGHIGGLSMWLVDFGPFFSWSIGCHCNNIMIDARGEVPYESDRDARRLV